MNGGVFRSADQAPRRYLGRPRYDPGTNEIHPSTTYSSTYIPLLSAAIGAESRESGQSGRLARWMYRRQTALLILTRTLLVVFFTYRGIALHWYIVAPIHRSTGIVGRRVQGQVPTLYNMYLRNR